MRIDEIERELRESEIALKEAGEHFGARRFNKAYQGYKQALGLLKRSFGENDSRTLSCLVSLGDAAYELKQFDEAAESYLSVLQIRERSGDIKDHEYPSALFKLARSYAQTTKTDQALKYFDRAAQSAKRLMLSGDPLLGNIYEAHSAFLVRIGRKNEAEALREEARLNRQQFGSSNQVVERYLESIAGEETIDLLAPGSGARENTIPPGSKLIGSRERDNTIPPGELNRSAIPAPNPVRSEKPAAGSGKGMILGVALCIVLALVGAGAYALFLKGDEPQQAAPAETLPEPVVAPVQHEKHISRPVRKPHAVKRVRRQPAAKPQLAPRPAVAPSNAASQWEKLKQQRMYR